MAEGARFCQSCGAALVGVGVDAGSAPVDVQTTHVRRRGVGWRQLLVAAAVVALGGMVAAAVFVPGGSSDDGANQTNQGPEAPAAPSPAATATPTASPDPTATPRPTRQPRPTPTPRAAAAPVDVNGLPELAATHLAVAARGDLQFLDLESGTWARADLTLEVYGMRPVGAGVVVVVPSGEVRFAPADGGEVIPITSNSGGGWMLGTTADLVVLNTNALGRSGVGEAVEARRVDGSLAWAVELPAGAYAMSVTADGSVVLQASERVALLDPTVGTITPVATGSVVGHLGDLVLVQSCTPSLDCGIDQIHVGTGDTHRIVEGPGWFDSAGDDVLRFGSPSHHQELLFRLVDGVLRPDPDPPTEPLQQGPQAVDATGITVDVVGLEIRMRDHTGEILAALPAPFDSCCSGNVNVALLTLAT